MSMRQSQVGFRLGMSFAVAFCIGQFVGWHQVLAVLTAYLALMLIEYRSFSSQRAWLELPGRAGNVTALIILVANSAVFGMPSLFVVWQLGLWGAVCGSFLLAGAMLSVLMMTIGCRAAFLASSLPYFTYTFILAFNTYEAAGQQDYRIGVALGCGAVLILFSLVRSWQEWSTTKAAEAMAVMRYIAERDDNEKRLSLLAQQDSLTGLPNRSLLRLSLGEVVAGSAPGALLMVDLDGFKYVNDTLGHSAGDLVLCEIASRIAAAARANDITARLGGDEFALLLPGVDDPALAADIATRLIAAVSQPVKVDDKMMNIGASIGIAIYPAHGEDAEALFANADLALYQAKAEGRNCSRFYNPELRNAAQGKMLRETELRAAVDNGEFELFYQPQIRLSDGTLAGAEALLRWRHPEKGLLLPETFLAALETGLLSARLGDWVIQTACAQAASWRAQGVAHFKIGVNLFGAQFRSGNLVETVTGACKAVNLPPGALEIEITENIILRHEDALIGPLRALRTAGVGISFDDYGTGYASLSLLTRYPLSRLKIDKRFIKGISSSPADAAIIRAVITMAHALNLEVIAEGVETSAQLRLLQQDGCDAAQGFLVGPPMSAADFKLYAASNHNLIMPLAAAS